MNHQIPHPGAVAVSIGAEEVELLVAVVQAQPAAVLAVGTVAVAAIQGAVGALALVLFEVDGDDADPALRVVFGGRVGDELDVFQLLGGQGAQVVGQLGAAHRLAFAINQHQQALFAAQGQVVVGVHRHARGAAQHVEAGVARRQRRTLHVDDGAVGLALVQRRLAHHRHFLQLRGRAGGQLQHQQFNRAPAGLKGPGPAPVKPHLGRRHDAAPRRSRFKLKSALVVAELGFDYG
jgi:hypothetical protein